MPDITDSILNEYNNPYADPLPPSTQEVLAYADTLIYEGNQLDFDWAHSEIKAHTLNWVRVGLVAYRVRLYRLYHKQYRRFQDYCEEALGRSLFQIKNLIKASAVMVELARAGFEILPHCVSQAMKLHRYLESGELIEKWEEVINSMPAHRITAYAIDKSLGHELPKKVRLNVPRRISDRLQEIAADWGVKVEELLEELLDEYEGKNEPESEETDADVVEEVSHEKMAVWEQDLEGLVSEYESQQFLWCWLVKLIRPLKNHTQFSWIS